MQTQRFSFQREQIYEAVCASKAHPTAEMVYTWLKPAMPRLSLGTVYRNLHQMAEEGRLLELEGPVVRFDGNTLPHTHLRCVRCGGVSDLDGLPYDAELDRLAVQQGVQVRGHVLFFVGLCSECGSREKKERADQNLERGM